MLFWWSLANDSGECDEKETGMPDKVEEFQRVGSDSGITGHVQTEWVVTMGRNTHTHRDSLT
jgi:hypothetical protein